MSSEIHPVPFRISATVLAQLFLYLTSLKIDPDDFLVSLGIDPAEVKSPDAYIPVDTYLRIQEEAARQTNDACFGLHMGEYAEPGSWSILGYMMMNCKTLGQVFEKSARYSRLIGNLIDARGEILPDRIKMVLFTPPHAPKMSRHCFEATLSSSVRMNRTLTGANLNPLEVTFTYSQPESTAEYERVFGCPVRFEQPENSISHPLSILAAPIRMANPGLLEYFENYAQEILAEMEAKDKTGRVVTKIILAHLDDETLSIEKVAGEMALSVRTLQKRLEDEGLLFSDLLKDIRQRLAKKYLHEDYSVEQITYLLGFSEPSVFRKAFKKWAGVTPKEYREMAYSGSGRI